MEDKMITKQELKLPVDVDTTYEGDVDLRLGTFFHAQDGFKGCIL